jgi:CTP:phosphocholine cytidylyltransferase-like protein
MVKFDPKERLISKAQKNSQNQYIIHAIHYLWRNIFLERDDFALISALMNQVLSTMVDVVPIRKNKSTILI